jgi:hypothetical protein
LKKKSMMLFVGAVVALVLIVAQLALAQQDTLPAQPVNTTTKQNPTGGTQPAGDGQSQAADPSGQNGASQAQPAAGAGGALPDLMHLDQNHNLMIDCQAVSDKLAQLNNATPANDLQLQGASVGDEELLAGLCADSGFVPANSSGVNQPSLNATGPTQPQQSQGTSTPATNGGNNGTSPNATGSALPQQQGQPTTTPTTTTPSGG